MQHIFHKFLQKTTFLPLKIQTFSLSKNSNILSIIHPIIDPNINILLILHIDLFFNNLGDIYSRYCSINLSSKNIFPIKNASKLLVHTVFNDRIRIYTFFFIGTICDEINWYFVLTCFFVWYCYDFNWEINAGYAM